MHACMYVFVVYVKQLKYMYMYAMVIRVIDLWLFAATLCKYTHL